MTALELNAQIYQSLGLLATDEHYLKKAADFLKTLVKSKKKEDAMSKEDIKESISQACEELKQYKKGKMEFGNWEDLYNELHG